MITEWQPVMLGDKLKLKARTIYEFLRGDHSTMLIVGRGVEQEADVDPLIKDEDIVAWREYETKPLPLAAMGVGKKS